MYSWRVKFLYQKTDRYVSSAKVCRYVLDNPHVSKIIDSNPDPCEQLPCIEATDLGVIQYRSNFLHIFSEFCRLSFWGRHEPYLCPQPTVPLLIHLSNATQNPRFPSYTTFFEMFLLCISLGWTRIMTKAWDASISCFQPYAPIGPQTVLLSGTAGCFAI